MSLTQTTVKIRSGNASRIVWIDVARGIGILLVVVGHTLRGLVSARIVDSSSTTQFVDRLIYSFHMPLFFVLAALFVNRQAKSPRAILTAKVRTLVYPYFVWSILSVLLQHAAA